MVNAFQVDESQSSYRSLLITKLTIFLQIHYRYHPQEVWARFPALKSAASYYFAAPRPSYVVPGNHAPFGARAQDLSAWCSAQIMEERPKSLLLFGDTGRGKSRWARSLCPSGTWFNRGRLDLGEYREGDKVVIADDIRNFNFEDWKDFFGGQDQTTFRQSGTGHVKTYKGPWMFIFLCNELPEFTEGQERYLNPEFFGHPDSRGYYNCRIEEIRENLWA